MPSLVPLFDGAPGLRLPVAPGPHRCSRLATGAVTDLPRDAGRARPDRGRRGPRGKVDRSQHRAGRRGRPRHCSRMAWRSRRRPADQFASLGRAFNENTGRPAGASRTTSGRSAAGFAQMMLRFGEALAATDHLQPAAPRDRGVCGGINVELARQLVDGGEALVEFGDKARRHGRVSARCRARDVRVSIWPGRRVRAGTARERRPGRRARRDRARRMPNATWTVEQQALVDGLPPGAPAWSCMAARFKELAPSGSASRSRWRSRTSTTSSGSTTAGASNRRRRAQRRFPPTCCRGARQRTRRPRRLNDGRARNRRPAGNRPGKAGASRRKCGGSWRGSSSRPPASESGVHRKLRRRRLPGGGIAGAARRGFRRRRLRGEADREETGLRWQRPFAPQPRVSQATRGQPTGQLQSRAVREAIQTNGRR